jgi:hypothetical protein
MVDGCVRMVSGILVGSGFGKLQLQRRMDTFEQADEVFALIGHQGT